MKSRVIFLGTGSGRHTTSSQSRATGGIIIQVGAHQIHLDPGPGALIRARQYGVDPMKTDVILVSHEHVDNCNDANLMIDVLTSGGKEKGGFLVSNKKFYDNILTDFHESCLKGSKVLEPGKEVKLDKLIIRAIPTKNHADSIGFKIITSNFVLGYTADTAYSQEMANALERCDILIVNNTLPFMKSGAKPTHMTSGDTVKLLKKAKPKLAILQHFGNMVLKAKPMYEAREIQKQSGVQVIAADDGLSLDPAEYSAKGDQKRLMQY